MHVQPSALAEPSGWLWKETCTHKHASTIHIHMHSCLFNIITIYVIIIVIIVIYYILLFCYYYNILLYSPHLCVGFLFLVVHFRLPAPAPARRPHTTYSHTHNLLTHNLSTHNLLSHNLSTHNLLSHLFPQTYSHTTCPHTTYSHTT